MTADCEVESEQEVQMYIGDVILLFGGAKRWLVSQVGALRGTLSLEPKQLLFRL